MIGPPGVEDPISAIFDLSDRVAEMAPTVRRMYRYTATILVVWIILTAILTLIAFTGGQWLFLFLVVLGLAAGLIALSLLRQTDRFFRSFASRHRAIRLVREADPVVKIPEGRTPVERLARYLAGSNDSVDRLLKESPGALRYRVTIPGTNRPVALDLVLARKGSLRWRVTGRGDPGYAIVARVLSDQPTLDEMRRFEADLGEVGGKLEAPVARAILLRTKPGPISEDIYEFSVGHPVVVGYRLGKNRTTLEIITENPDGTYDFVPHVLGIPG